MTEEKDEETVAQDPALEVPPSTEATLNRVPEAIASRPEARTTAVHLIIPVAPEATAGIRLGNEVISGNLRERLGIASNMFHLLFKDPFVNTNK